MSLEPIRQSRSSIQLLQALRTDVKDINNLYQLIGLDVPTNPAHHLGHITERFFSPCAIVVVGELTTCYLIQRFSAYEFDVVTIESETEYQHLKSSQLQSIIYKNLNADNNVQGPLYKKLVFILDIKEMAGIIAYCKDSNHLMIGANPLELEDSVDFINCKNTIQKFLNTRKWDKTKMGTI